MIFLIIGFIIIAILLTSSLLIWKYCLYIQKVGVLLFEVDIDDNKMIIRTLLDKEPDDKLKSLAMMFDKKINSNGSISLPLIKFLEHNETNSKSIINSLLITLKKFHNNAPKIDWRKKFNIILNNEKHKPKNEPFDLKFKMSLLSYSDNKRILYGQLSSNLSFFKKDFSKIYKNKVLNYDIDNKIMKMSHLQKYKTGVVIYINLNDFLSNLIGKKSGMIGIIKNILFEYLCKNGYIITSEKHLEFYIFKFSKLKNVNSRKIINNIFKIIFKRISKTLSINMPFKAGISYIHDLKNVNTINSLRQKAKFAYSMLEEKRFKDLMKSGNYFNYIIFNVMDNEETYKQFMNCYLIFKTAISKANFVFNSNPIIDYEKNHLIGNLIDILPVENISVFKEKNVRRQIKAVGLEEEYDIFAFKLLKKRIINFKNKETYIIRISSMTLLNQINAFAINQDHNINNRIIILINDFEKLSLNHMIDIVRRLRNCNYKIALYNVDNYLVSEQYFRVLIPELIFVSRKLTNNIHNNVENQIKILTIQKSLSNNRNCLVIEKPKTPEDNIFLSEHSFKNLVS